MHSGEQRRPARAASGLSDISVTEANSALYELIDIGRLDPFVPHDPKSIVPLIVSEQKNDIRSVLWFLNSPGPPGNQRRRG
jgi:hypothetical protein